MEININTLAQFTQVSVAAQKENYGALALSHWAFILVKSDIFTTVACGLAEVVSAVRCSPECIWVLGVFLA